MRRTGCALQHQRITLNAMSAQGAHTICLCSRLLFYSKCTEFTVCRWNSQGRTQIHSKSLKKTAFEAKGQLYTTGKVIQRLFIIDLYT